MLIYYNTKSGTSPAAVKKQVLRAFFLLFSIFSFTFSSAGQTQEAPSADIIALLSQRTALLEQGQSTRELDSQLFAAGYRPKAMVSSSQTLENGALRITFPVYRPVAETDKPRVIQRISNAHPFLESLEIDTVVKEATIIVPATTSPEDLDAVFIHFGYLGHEAF